MRTTVERRLNTGMTDSGEDPLFEKNVDLLNMGGPLDVTEDVAVFPRRVVAAGDVREGLEDRKPGGRMAHRVPRAGRRLVLDAGANVAQHSHDLFLPARQRFNKDVEGLRALGAVVAGHHDARVRALVDMIVRHGGS